MNASRHGSLVLALVFVACGGGGSEGAQPSDGGGTDAPTNGDVQTDAPIDAAPLDPSDWLDKPLRDQVAVLETGALSCAGLTKGYLDRIDARDRGATGFHAVLALSPTAATDASGLDTARGKGARLQCGVVLVKDQCHAGNVLLSAPPRRWVRVFAETPTNLRGGAL